MSRAIGMVEYKTVASGVKAADLIVKTAQVELLQSQTVCPGKYIILFAGELSAVRVCVDAAQKEYPESLIDQFVLGNPHEDIFKALTCTAEIDNVDALGVIETFTGALQLLLQIMQQRLPKYSYLRFVLREVCVVSHTYY